MCFIKLIKFLNQMTWPLLLRLISEFKNVLKQFKIPCLIFYCHFLFQLMAFLYMKIKKKTLNMEIFSCFYTYCLNVKSFERELVKLFNYEISFVKHVELNYPNQKIRQLSMWYTEPLDSCFNLIISHQQSIPLSLFILISGLRLIE